MPSTLRGSCRCGARSASRSRATRPCPISSGYCSICRKTAGGGGYAINIMGDAGTLKVEGETSIGVFRAELCDDDGACETSSGQRRFCTGCGTALWMYDPSWPELVHPFASGDRYRPAGG